MEAIEDTQMETLEVKDERAVFPMDGYTLSSSSFKGGDNSGNDSALYEKFLLDDLDSYWDEINDRITVSRMVSDSVIKGMVTAITEEAAEKIALREEKIEALSERLRSYEFDAAQGSKLVSSMMMPKPSAMKVHTHKIESEFPENWSYSSKEWNCMEVFGKFRNTVEKQLRTLTVPLKNVKSLLSLSGLDSSCSNLGSCHQGKMMENFLKIDEKVDALGLTLREGFVQMNSMLCSMKTSACERELEHDIQCEVVNLVIQDSVGGLHDKFETKLYEQRRLVTTLNANWQEKVAELSTMCEELDSLSRSLFSLEPGVLFLHNSHESLEERNSSNLKTSGDNSELMQDVADSPHLKNMANEELITYFKTVVRKMRRQHDSVLTETTEEFFKLKREYLKLKEKGSSPFRKDKEFELLRKKIPEIISKLDDILLLKEEPTLVYDDHDELRGLKDRIDIMSFENQRLQGLLTGKRKEVKCLSSQITDAASQMSLHSSVEAKFLIQIKKLKQVISDHISGMKDIEIESKILEDIYSIILRGAVGDVLSTMNPFISKYLTERSSLEKILFEKEKALCLEIEENEKLKKNNFSLSTIIKEKEKLAAEAGSILSQQKEHFDLVNQELEMFRERVSKQEILMSEKKTTFDSRVHQYELEMNKLNQKFKIASDALEEAEKQKTILHNVIEEQKRALSSATTRKKEQEKQTKCMVNSVMELSKVVADSEKNLAEVIERNESRLEILSHQCIPLVQQASLLSKKESTYKRFLELKSSNLRKAEKEVDLLGDEVDALLSLLGKIYIALDHYSPVFELYPGVTDILKLVQRELKGETIRLP